MKDQVGKELQGIKEEPEEDSVLQSGDKKESNFDSKKFKKSLEATKRNMKGMKGEGGHQKDPDDIPHDPFFLAKYRSFHNHDLDTNYVEHACLVMDEDLHKKGSANLLPQGPCAIQWLSGQRRKEIPEEGKMPEMPIQFDQNTTV